MKKGYNALDIDFMIGGVFCLLMDIQPDNSVERREGTYYEHCHPCYELHYVQSGKVEYVCNQKMLTVTGGDLLIIPPRTYHKEFSCTENSMKMAILMDMQEPKPSAVPETRSFYATFCEQGLCTVRIENTPLVDCFLNLKALASKNETGFLDREKMRVAFCNVMLELYERLSDSAHHYTHLFQDTPLTREHEIDTFIALNFMSNASKDQLAEQLHISPRQLHRIIRKSYGKNYRDKITEIRLEIASGFLSSSEKSITEISQLLGYSCVANFSTFIKNATGQTPSQIRKEKLNGSLIASKSLKIQKLD